MQTITGSITSSLAPITASQALPPHTYMGIARNMLPGVQVLAEAMPSSTLPLAMVSAHALECILKAYLSRSGDDKPLRKNDIRHNLVALWSLAHSQGFDVQQTPPEWVTILSHLHDSPYYLRYSSGVHGLMTPAAEPMVTELNQLFDRLVSRI